MRFYDWALRFVKGMFIGTGTILPGVSGGALAAVFGLYEEIIAFLANITQDFKRNILYFLPVGLGGLFGIFTLSFVLSYFFEHYETEMIWFFVGCMIGIFPALFKQAGKKGRESYHYGIMIVTAIATFLLLHRMEALIEGALPLNFLTWVIGGGIFGLGMIIPGLSPSNFLVYLDMYQPMTNGIKHLDLSIILPLCIGLLLIVFLFAKLANLLFAKAYTGMYHFIVGIIIASTIMIFPGKINYLSIFAILFGISVGWCMSRLEEQYK